MAQSITLAEKQIFQDIAETGMLNSLRALSKLSHRQWSAFPHRFSFVPIGETAGMFPEQEPVRFGGDLIITGDIPMSMLFMFPQESAMNLTHFITDETSLRMAELPALQLLTVAEVSNIMANRFLSVIANTLKVRILPSEPRAQVATRRSLLETSAARADVTATHYVTADFRLESNHMAMMGTVCFLMNAADLKTLIEKIHSSPAWTSQDRGVY